MNSISIERGGISVGYAGTEAPEVAREQREIESMIRCVREANEVAAHISGHLKTMKSRLLGVNDQLQADKANEPAPVHCELKEMRISLDALRGRLNDIANDVQELDRV